MIGHTDPTNYTADIERTQKEVADDNSGNGVIDEE